MESRVPFSGTIDRLKPKVFSRSAAHSQSIRQGHQARPVRAPSLVFNAMNKLDEVFSWPNGAYSVRPQLCGNVVRMAGCQRLFGLSRFEIINDLFETVSRENIVES